MLEKSGLTTVLLKSTVKEHLTDSFVKCVSLCCDTLNFHNVFSVWHLKCHLKALSAEPVPQSGCKSQEDGDFIAQGLLCVAILSTQQWMMVMWTTWRLDDDCIITNNLIRNWWWYAFNAPHIGVYNCQIGTIVKPKKMANQNLRLSRGNVHSGRNRLSEHPCHTVWTAYSLWTYVVNILCEWIALNIPSVWGAVQYYSRTTMRLWRVHYVVAASHWHKQYSVADPFYW